MKMVALALTLNTNQMARIQQILVEIWESSDAVPISLDLTSFRELDPAWWGYPGFSRRALGRLHAPLSGVFEADD